jgi:hypothetical protein
LISKKRVGDGTPSVTHAHAPMLAMSWAFAPSATSRDAWASSS